MRQRGASRLGARGWAFWAVVSLAFCTSAEAAVPRALRWSLVSAVQAEAGAGADDPPVCVPVAPGALVACLRWWDGSETRWVRSSELDVWRVSLNTVVDVLRRRSARAIIAAGDLRPVEGTDASVWVASVGDGWGGSAWMHPERLTGILGPGPLRLASPNLDAVLVWPGGVDAVDTILAVAVADAYGAERAPVSPVVATWGPVGWTAWAEATVP